MALVQRPARGIWSGLYAPPVYASEHDLLAAYRALNTRQQGALLEVARGMAGHTARRKR